ncbi:hypothetical protein EPYR_01694 [Erwinia pyrifoliae DSM 12163]|nr:hypothetical protein EPYR_01694 [Erwinia pyrifoliae DSM 12163]
MLFKLAKCLPGSAVTFAKKALLRQWLTRSKPSPPDISLRLKENDQGQ